MNNIINNNNNNNDDDDNNSDNNNKNNNSVYYDIGNDNAYTYPGLNTNFWRHLPSGHENFNFYLLDTILTCPAKGVIA